MAKRPLVDLGSSLDDARRGRTGAKGDTGDTGAPGRDGRDGLDGGPALAAHVAAADPHPVYLLEAEADARYAQLSTLAEAVRDAIGAALAAGADITITVDDPGDTITIAYSGSGIAHGSANPGAPSLHDVFYRDDLGLLIFYDGTRWLTVQEYALPPAADSTAFDGTNTAPRSRYWPVDRSYGIYLTRVVTQTFVDTTNSGAAYYNFTMTSRVASNASTTIVTWTTQSDSPSVWVDHSQAINAVLDANALSMIVSIAKTGAPGVLYAPTQIHYRLIVP